MRLLIKLSGESLLGNHSKATIDPPYDTDTLDHIVGSIKTLHDSGHTVALVVGGGNLFRGHKLTEQLAIERSTADYIGMLATLQNALVLRDYFERHGIRTRVSSAIAMAQICENYMPLRAERHMEKGRVVIFASGLGTPYFTTDSTAVQRALEMRMDMLIMAKNGVNGLYTSDPDTDSSAQFIDSISATKLLTLNLRVADQSAIALAKEHGLKIKIVGISDIGHALDEHTGSFILPE